MRNRLVVAGRKPADLAQLYVDDVHRVIRVSAQEYGDAIDDLVQDHRSPRSASHAQAFLIGLAGLLEIDVEVLDAGKDAHGLVR